LSTWAQYRANDTILIATGMAVGHWDRSPAPSSRRPERGSLVEGLFESRFARVLGHRCASRAPLIVLPPKNCPGACSVNSESSCFRLCPETESNCGEPDLEEWASHWAVGRTYSAGGFLDLAPRRRLKFFKYCSQRPRPSPARALPTFHRPTPEVLGGPPRLPPTGCRLPRARSPCSKTRL
jgi:hypothetical protein